MRRRHLLKVTSPLALAGCLRLQSETEGDSQQITETTSTAIRQTTTETTSRETAGTESRTTNGPESTIEESTTSEPNQDANFQILVDWSFFEGEFASSVDPVDYYGLSSAPSLGQEDTVTNVGVRLEYRDDDAVFTQSLDRSSSEDQEVIQMDVPPSNQAIISLATVSDDGSEQTAVAFASEEGVEIGSESATDWSVSDFDWLKAEWFLDPVHEEEYQEGEFKVSKDEENFALGYQATNPYPSLQDPPYMVGIEGVGNHGENYENTREYNYVAENHVPGEDVEIYYDGYPALNSGKFDLPARRYFILPKIEFTVHWTDT